MSVFSHAVTLQLFHCFPGSVLLAQQLIAILAFFNSKFADTSLEALNVRYVEVNLLFEDHQILVHLDFEVVAAGFYLGFKHVHVFFLQN